MHISTALAAVLLSACTAAAAATCSPGSRPLPFPAGELSKDQFTAKGRRYRVHLPKSYDPTRRAPVILSYHGAHGTIEKQVALDGLTDPSRSNRDGDGYVVVYLQALVPAGASDPTKTEWQVAPAAAADKAHIDDLGFTADVLAALEASLCVDTRRLYATGKSQGGGFVGRVLACDTSSSSGLAHRFAAFAPVAGAYYILDTPRRAQCEPTDRVAIPCGGGGAREEGTPATPILAFHGGADETIPYRGEWRRATGSCLPDIRHWARQWVLPSSSASSSATAEKNTTIPGSRHGVRSAWGGSGGPGKDGEEEEAARVVLVYAGDDIGHDWPSTAENADNKGGPRAAFNASDEIVDWFGKWRLE
ncbi:Alpha/Beta hydrolase protein [Apiospora aurea]|uniref:feruloyl esterase n=1 Tax=Apiospora aurea TaxID=335848 RepID=A0ABR1QGA5_9PEZI